MIPHRRKFLGALAALAASSGASAQRKYRIAVLLHGSERTHRARFDALRAALKDHGYTEGKNLTLAVRFNDGPLERLRDLSAELLRDGPDAFAAGPVLAAAAVQANTRTVPVVIMWGAGAVKIGLARSFARPGTNVTGLETQNEELTPKHLEMLRTAAPGVATVGVLNTGRYLFHEEAWEAAAKAAQSMKLKLVDVRVSVPEDLERLAAACGKAACNGLYVMPDPILINWRARIIEMAAKLRLPAVYYQPEFTAEGGLMSYSPNIEHLCYRAGGYVDRILKGAKPAEMPIERPAKFELMINLTTARALGLTIPGEMLSRADRVIR